jgi:GT2 family glycosyltransferase/thioredoxin-like negative regulator of GroEL
MPRLADDDSPSDNPLASLIVLCCNELDYTRRCLDSVRRHTRPPFELIVVDNGSTDGTPAFLEDLRHWWGQPPEPVHVEVIRNDTNRGFPAGVNQGLARARGRFLVLLNNDTVVTYGWLDGLIAQAERGGPAVGLVGPVTNCSAPPQQIPVPYTDRAGLEDFADRRRRQFAGRLLEVERLTGFCLLVRRQVLERIGGLDERYGLGFFDDDDLCLRARQAGFRLVVAPDVFVHHYGERTLIGLGVDLLGQLHQNFQLFRAKWGTERTAHYRLPSRTSDEPGADASPPVQEAALTEAAGNESLGDSAPVAADPSAGTEAAPLGAERPRVSLCLIVRDEEANLPACLGSAADLVDEIIVVDTGSADRTREVAASFGAKVYDFAWVDDFATARNESLRHATGAWVFWLDADDRLDEDNRRKLRDLFAGLKEENVAYVLKCLCLPDDSGTATVVDHVRLFPNHPALRWQYRVHEQILPALRRLGAEVRRADIVIQHAGYQDPARRGAKLDRDLRLLQLEANEHPDDPFTLFNLGAVYQAQGRPAEALPLLRRSLERSHPADSIVRKLYALVALCHRQLGNRHEALAACREGRGYYPDDVELLFQEGLARRELGDHFASVTAGLGGYLTRHNLAVVYAEQGRHPEAESQWRAALAERPDFEPAWLGLGELYLAQRRWPELEETARRWEERPAGAVQAEVLRARGELARREFAAARQRLEELIAREPEALAPREILSHVLLQEGRDWDAAEAALRHVLQLAPNHRAARRNLATLLRQREPVAGAS